MNRYLRLLISIVIMAFTHSVNGQFYYKKGRIITTQNDTLFGLIRDGGALKNSQRCVFKTDKKSKAHTYAPTDLKSYLLFGDKYYSSQSISYKNKKHDCFMDVLIAGELNLYFYRKNNEELYYVQKPHGELIGLRNEQIYLRPANVPADVYQVKYLVRSNAYKDTLFSIFNDCKKVQPKIPELEYKHEALMQITKEYLSCKCKTDSCISYERNLQLSKPSMGIFTGIELSSAQFSALDVSSEVAFAFPVGIYYDIPLAIVSPYLSFQLEGIYTRYNKNQKFSNQMGILEDLTIQAEKIGIPLLVKFKLPLQNFTPTLGFGREFSVLFNSEISYNGRFLRPDGVMDFGEIEALNHRFQRGGWFFDIGTQYKLNENVALFSSVRFKSQYSLIIDDGYNNNYTYIMAKNKADGIEYQTNTATLRLGIRF